MADPAFESWLCRGVILRLTLDSSVLDDPHIVTREKYVVVLNNLCPDDPVYFVMATSQVERFGKVAHLASEVVFLDQAGYAFLTRATALDFTSVKSMGLSAMAALYRRGLVEVVGQLEANDLARCDEVIKRSRSIEPRLMPYILPGSFI